MRATRHTELLDTAIDAHVICRTMLRRRHRARVASEDRARRVRQRAWTWLLRTTRVGAGALLLAGCIVSRSRSVTVQLASGAQQNVANGRPNAVVVRVYQLTARGNFDRASPVALWRDDVTALGDELVARREVTLLPAGAERLTMKLADKTRFVAVAADFYNPETDQWRQALPVSSRKKQIRVRIAERRLSIE
jgi:type VI secretion system protein VasD